MVHPPRPVLARGKVRHVGEAVAFVVAESQAAAQDASEAILVDYKDLPTVIDPRCSAGRRRATNCRRSARQSDLRLPHR